MWEYHRHSSDSHQVTFLLIMTSAASVVTCLGTSPTGLKSSQKSPLPFDIMQNYKQKLQVEKLKAQILRSLNLTSEPEPPTKKPPEPISSHLAAPGNYTRNHQSALPDSMLWSEPIDMRKENENQLLFRVSNQKSQSAIIDQVSLSLRLRCKENTQKQKHRAKMKVPGKKNKEKHSAVKGEDFQNDQHQNRGVKKTLKPTQKKPRKSGRRRKKARYVKVLVQAMNKKSGKFKRIVVKRVQVTSKFQWITMPIPVDLVLQAVQSANQTLVLRIRCKRCYEQKVSIDNTLRKSKKHRNSEERSNDYPSLNPNRPYLSIRNAIKPLSIKTSSVLQRFTRHVDSLCSSQSDLISSCCAKQITLSFKDLGWDHWIIYPKSFTTVLCYNMCNEADLSNKEMVSQGKPNRSLTNKKWLWSNDHRILQPSRNKDVEESTSKDNSISLKVDQSKAVRSCIVKGKTSLDVMYYINQNTIVRSVIKDQLGQDCACGFLN